ncbi:DUF6228 family protein [Leptothoe sp. PORK10 BA2]|uniref:DUF6228 family protein n=1 Tax=Leptothoe sp. PORK10 BA2 TaxID=3110254 RepID=UPI002B21B1F8|nr:DUF6228 family protein [Leptothoe sp. PORK10 BA2]MEA5466693.1 DUF6228 family protein [Leptothoe sp. PORK10 BA2]
MRLASSNSDVTFDFSDVDGDYFCVSVMAPDHSARRRVCAYTDRSGVARLFAEAARDWKGWSGEKVWESLEGELRIALTIDRLGHVIVALCIRSDPGSSDRWNLKSELGLDAGQLEAVAKNAERLWCGGG